MTTQMSPYGLILLLLLVLVGVLVMVGAIWLLTRRSRRVPPIPPPGRVVPAGRPEPHVAGYMAPLDASATMLERGGSSGAAGMTWQLTAMAGPDAGRVYPLGMRAQIGRGPGNEVQLRDDLASRAHALIEWRGSGYAISDLASSNGTFVNDARLAQPAWLRIGDVVQIGNTRLAVAAAGPAAPPSGAAYQPGVPPMAAGGGVTLGPPVERGGCVTFKVGLLLVGFMVFWVIVAAAVYLFTREPLALAGVGLAALISLIFMIVSLSSSWHGQIVEIRTERVRMTDSDGDAHWEDQQFAYIRQPNRRNPRKMRAMPGWEIGDWLEKRRGETNIRVRRG
jgi:hypothetical protein